MKNKILVACSIILSIAMLCSCSGSKYYNEWVMKGDNNYYYDETGNKVKNSECNINGGTYYFDNSGKMCTGFQDVDGTKKYYDKNGKRLRGWQRINNDYYCFNNQDGEMMTGWIHDMDDDKCYVDENGAMLKNMKKIIGGKTYIFDENGKGTEGPYFQATSFFGKPMNFYLKTKLPATFSNYGYSWVLDENLAMEISMDRKDIFLKITGIVTLEKNKNGDTRDPYRIKCRLSMKDENGITTSTESYGKGQTIKEGEKTYATWNLYGLPLNGGNIDVEFYYD